MASLEPSGARPLLRAAVWPALVAIGIALSVWAVVGIVAQTSAVTEPIVPTRRTPIDTADTSATPDSTATAETTPTAAPVLAYPANPKKGDIFGALTIPALGQTFPIVQGTGSDELKRGVGHMVETAMPGEPDNCVISGHRDTVFTDLGKLKGKDLLVIETARGTFTYSIRAIRIVHKDDRTVVVPADHAVLTVSTCYPFRYVGSAPDRYVLVADLVPGK